MTFENFPPAQQTPPPRPQKNNMRNLLTGGLIVALLGTWGYVIWDKNKSKEAMEQRDTQLASATTEKDQLKKELDEATMLYDMIKTSSANMAHSKDSIITKRDKEILDKKNRIQQLLSKVNATQAELKEAKELIASLNTDIAGYRTQIETLEGEKIVLTQERDVARKDYDSATTVIKQKEEVIDVASTLHASNFSIVGINEKNNGKEKETTTAKRVDKLRISFDLDENRVTPSGSKAIYVCITAPDGTPISSEAMGSGTFSTRDGQEKFFTQKMDVNYTQGQRQTVSFDWKQPTNFTTGSYKIEIYNNGFKIGEGMRSLKKGGLFG